MVAACQSLELRDVRDGRSHLPDLLDDEARPAMLDDLGHGAPRSPVPHAIDSAITRPKAESAQQRKIEAMKTDRTQFSALEAGGQHRLTHPQFVRREVVWIRPAP